jgi:hypothetical protein
VTHALVHHEAAQSTRRFGFLLFFLGFIEFNFSLRDLRTTMVETFRGARKFSALIVGSRIKAKVLSHHNAHEGHEGLGKEGLGNQNLNSELRALRDLRGENSDSTSAAALPRRFFVVVISPHETRKSQKG